MGCQWVVYDPSSSEELCRTDSLERAKQYVRDSRWPNDPVPTFTTRPNGEVWASCGCVIFPPTDNKR